MTFKYKKYKDGEITPKIMTLKAEEFIRRFLLHVLPKGFRKIRYFGFLSNGLKNKYIQIARQSLEVMVEKLEQINSDFNDMLEKLFKCPCCKVGTLHVVEAFNRWKFAPG